MAMEMIEVDPKLFVTCRLCLEDLGQYQIVPSVQQQIKYCFDIHVESFDGLPQLICIKCKNILNKFYTTKKTFLEKQADLKSKLLKKEEIYVQPQHDAVSSSQQPAENIDNTKLKKSKKKRRVIHSSSSSDLESEKSYKVTKPKQKKKSPRHNVTKPMAWEDDYQKYLVCKLCNSSFLNKRAILNHIKSHELLKARYKNIFSRQCAVNLEKIYDKPNITGLLNMVVHSSDKIVAPGNSYYYTVYSKKSGNISNSTSNANHLGSNVLELTQDCTDDYEEIMSKPRKKRGRLLSRSSNETVVIETNGNKILSDNEEDDHIATHTGINEQIPNEQCINIDDSSDSDSDRGNFESSQRVNRQPLEAKLGDYKIIQGIISMCVNTYHKKSESTDADTYMDVMQNKKMVRIKVTSDSQLKHKVLSIGRKIINKQGFNCTGLLRYMEHKNLEIVWMTKALTSYTNKETNYIRILTKLRDLETTDDNTGWVKIAKGPDNSVNDAAATTIETNMPAKIETSQLQELQDQSKLDTTAAILYYDNSGSSTELKKLLNANPVANPKQLPKKVGTVIESRPNKIVVAHPNICQSNIEDSNFCMPIITSTTSLATAPNTETNEDGNQSNSVSSAVIVDKEKPAPRIKVKPVSELMSERILNSLMTEQLPRVPDSNMLTSQIENVWPHQQPINVFVPNMAPQMQAAGQPMQIVQMPSLNSIAPTYQAQPNPTTSNIKKDYVILDTIELPNTKTESPFKYFKDLLQIHNLVLLDPYGVLSREFDCLIKFRVSFKQHAKEQPVILCLSLFCFKNVFCLNVRDRNQEIIDINKISANWQWEILQTYRREVADKVLQNAQKISKETYDLTYNFFCLLKSINCTKLS